MKEKSENTTDNRMTGQAAARSGKLPGKLGTKLPAAIALALILFFSAVPFLIGKFAPTQRENPADETKSDDSKSSK